MPIFLYLPCMKKDISELSLEDLKKSRAKLKGILIGFMVLGVIAITVLIILKPKPVLFIPVLSLPLTWLPVIIALKSAEKEIKLREANQA